MTTSEFAGVDGVRGAELTGPVQFGVVGVDRNDPSGPHQSRSGNRRVADAAAADHRDGVVPGDRAGVERCTQTCHHPAAQQAGDRGVGRGVDLGALAGVDQRLVGERPDAERRCELGAVGERHLLLGVERVETQVRPATFAGPALAADCAPVQDNEIARLDGSYARPDGLDGARGFMAEQERELVVDAALPVGQVGVAYPARGDIDDDFTRAWIGDDDVHQLDWLTLFS